MMVAQSEDTLNVETKVVTDQGDQTISAVYNLNGKEIEYATKRQGAEGKGRRTAKWTPDGNGFEVKEEEQFISLSGEVTLEFARKWQMLSDGKTHTRALKRTAKISCRSRGKGDETFR